MDAKPLLIRLTDDERTALERLRVSSGARSWAEVIRVLIGTADAPVTPIELDALAGCDADEFSVSPKSAQPRPPALAKEPR